MSKSPILPLAAALGALAGAQATTTDANANVPVSPAASAMPAEAARGGPTANTIVSTGENLLGFVIGERADGTVVAQHSSHASHASHHSHYSSR
jgi:hypothetical protein